MKQKNNQFRSSDLTFVATLILVSEKITIQEVNFHPNKQGVKVYTLTPVDEVHRLEKLYISDQLKVSPQVLSSKIQAIRYLPANTKNYE